MITAKCKKCNSLIQSKKKRITTCPKCGSRGKYLDRHIKPIKTNGLDGLILPAVAEKLEITHDELLLLMNHDREFLIHHLKEIGVL